MQYASTESSVQHLTESEEFQMSQVQNEKLASIISLNEELITTVHDFLNSDDYQVAIISTPTGAGKTSLIPELVKGRQTLVVQPGRMTYMTAEYLSALYEDNDSRIGYMMYGSNGVIPCFTANTEVLVTSASLAIQEKLTAEPELQIVVIDNAEVQSADQSVVMALLKKRMAKDSGLKVIVMTNSKSKELEKSLHDYWADMGTCTAGWDHDGEHWSKFVTEIPTPAYDTDATIAQAAIDLVTKKNHRGVIVYVDSQRRCHTYERIINEKLAALKDVKIEVSALHGNMAQECHQWARTDVPGDVTGRIIITTTIAETGELFEWATAGVTNGVCRHFVVTRPSGRMRTVVQSLSLGRIRVQYERLNNSNPERPSELVLVTPPAHVMKERQETNSAQIADMSDAYLVMHCANYGLQASALDLHPKVTTQDSLIATEHYLARLGIIDPDNSRLTEAGKQALRSPASPETAMFLYEAKRLGVLQHAIPMAAVMDCASVRNTPDNQISMRRDLYSTGCSNLRATQDYTHCRLSPKLAHNATVPAVMNSLGLNAARYREISDLITELEKYYHTAALYVAFNTEWVNQPARKNVADDAYYDVLKKLIVAVTVAHLPSIALRAVDRHGVGFRGVQEHPLHCDRYYQVSGITDKYVNTSSIGGALVVGRIRQATFADTMIISRATYISYDDMWDIIQSHPDLEASYVKPTDPTAPAYNIMVRRKSTDVAVSAYFEKNAEARFAEEDIAEAPEALPMAKDVPGTETVQDTEIHDDVEYVTMDGDEIVDAKSKLADHFSAC